MEQTVSLSPPGRIELEDGAEIAIGCFRLYFLKLVDQRQSRFRLRTAVA